MTAPPPGPARPRSRASRTRVRASRVPACSPVYLCVREAAEGCGDRGPASRTAVPGGLGSGVRMQTPRWRAGGPGRVPERLEGRGGRRAAVRWPPGGRLGEPRGLVSGLYAGELGRLTSQALGGVFQSQLPNWVRSGRQSGSLEASN